MKTRQIISVVLVVVLLLSTLVVAPQPSMAQKQLPDLVIPDAWQVGSQICYVIKNVGTSSFGSVGAPVSYYNALFIDGKKVAEDHVTTSLAPGQQLERCFNYQWQMTPPQHTLRVCADHRQEITESNEGNNGWEEVWVMVEEEKFPDLVVGKIECDQENSRIGYVIINNGRAIAPPGHAAVLFVDGKAVCKDVVGLELAPGGSHKSWFGCYTLPERQSIKVKVCADNYGQVKESDEQNNCLEKVCESIADITPPQIIAGPTVSKLTQTSAVICWGTDEASNSLVRYDYRSGKYGNIVEDPDLVKEHCLNLVKLEPGTIYHLLVESRDPGGNTVSSRDLSFDTLHPADKENPELGLCRLCLGGSQSIKYVYVLHD